MEEIKDMTPKLIGETYMKYPTKTSRHKRTFGLYECQYCNKEFEAWSYDVKSGDTKSCGCQKVTTLGIKHGLYNNRFYATWNNIFKDVIIQKGKSIKTMVVEVLQFVKRMVRC